MPLEEQNQYFRGKVFFKNFCQKGSGRILIDYRGEQKQSSVEIWNKNQANLAYLGIDIPFEGQEVFTLSWPSELNWQNWEQSTINALAFNQLKVLLEDATQRKVFIKSLGFFFKTWDLFLGQNGLNEKNFPFQCYATKANKQFFVCGHSNTPNKRAFGLFQNSLKQLSLVYYVLGHEVHIHLSKKNKGSRFEFNFYDGLSKTESKTDQKPLAQLVFNIDRCLE